MNLLGGGGYKQFKILKHSQGTKGYQAVPPPPRVSPPPPPPPALSHRTSPPPSSPGQVPTRSFPTRDITPPALPPRILYTIKNSGIHIIKRRIKITANGLEKIMHKYKNMRK